MHPTIQHQIAQARITDRQRQADRAAIARAARAARRGLTSQGPYPGVGLACRALSRLAARGLPALARSRRRPACRPLAPCDTCA
jgi:hypothetical protein